MAQRNGDTPGRHGSGAATASGPGGHAVTTGGVVGYRELKRRYFIALATGDSRAVGLLVSAVAWVGFVFAMIVGISGMRAVFAVADALTWGQAIVTFTPLEDGIDYLSASIGSSIAFLILVGAFFVETRLTGAFTATFVVAGALSLVLQGRHLRDRWVRALHHRRSDRSSQRMPEGSAQPAAEP